ncbi:MAG: NYN domain-containing protein [Deferribacteraceae bacterium]|jgi:uncharacterized LabA/DUF88 family protein|nr:NYN domain-containing protein [Deferribacteraceae bacterium]
METGELTPKKLVVLIDADNASPNIVKALFQEVAKYGIATVRRAYGDWTGSHLKGWKDVLLSYAIQPIQQFGYTTGKNSTDSALIIDAMDLLYTRTFDGFCIVSSDSDFTRLASRIREAGLTVYGFGEEKTPKPFINACDKFIFTEILKSGVEEETKLNKPMSSHTLKGNTSLMNLLRNAVETSVDESGWAYLANVGQQIANQSPEFDPRLYGYSKLKELIKATTLFNIDERKDEKSPKIKLIYVQSIKRKKPAQKAVDANTNNL